MKIEVVTLFPEFFTSPLETSIIARAGRQGQVEIAIHDLRDFAVDRHRTVDDTPYGGGGGMVIKPEPVVRAWEELDLAQAHCIYLTADGEQLDQGLAIELSLTEHLVLLCGHYKGIDERIRQRCIDREVSIGDYVLTGVNRLPWCSSTPWCDSFPASWGISVRRSKIPSRKNCSTARGTPGRSNSTGNASPKSC